MWRTKVAVSFGIALMVASQAPAQTLWDKVKKRAADVGKTVEKGVENTGDAIGQGAETVGGWIGKGADAVEESITSTGELLSNEETPEQTRARLDQMSGQILARLLAENAEARAAHEVSAGHAVFDARKVTVFPFTGGYGRGVAISPAGQRTYMNMGTGGVGAAFGIGGFASQFVIFFETPQDFRDFVELGYDATAQANSMSGEERDDEIARFVQGRSFFVLDKNGWRVAATAEGTKYWRSPELN